MGTPVTAEDPALTAHRIVVSSFLYRVIRFRTVGLFGACASACVRPCPSPKPHPPEWTTADALARG